jgi:phospholipase/lecithinase/hemolysin
MPAAARVAAVFKSWCFSIVVAFAVFAPERAVADPPHHAGFINRIVVFGTSLSDSGNAFALLGFNVTPPDYGMTTPLDLLTLIPSAPYATGGNHFSNGKTWIEQLAGAVGLGASVKPAFAPGADARASNYAVGGATAADLTALGGSQAHLGFQVAAFLTDVGGVAPSDAMYVAEMGGNDIRFALAFAAGGGDPALIIGAAVGAVVSNISELYEAGARKFLVWHAPNLGRTPAVQALGAVGPATALSLAYNEALKGFLDVLPAILPGIEIVQFDAFAGVEKIIAHPRRFGLTNVTDACIKPNVPPFRCKRLDDYLFWDGIHPTREGHRIIAFLVAKTLLTELVLDD